MRCGPPLTTSVIHNLPHFLGLMLKQLLKRPYYPIIIEGENSFSLGKITEKMENSVTIKFTNTDGDI